MLILSPFFFFLFSLGCVLTLLTYAKRAMSTALTHSCSKLLLILSNLSAAFQCPSSSGVIYCFLLCILHWWALCVPNGALWKKKKTVSLLISEMHSFLAIGSSLSPHPNVRCYWNDLQTRREGEIVMKIIDMLHYKKENWCFKVLWSSLVHSFLCSTCLWTISIFYFLIYSLI